MNKQNKSIINFSIIGAGAVGCLWAFKLQPIANTNVQLINRDFWHDPIHSSHAKPNYIKIYANHQSQPCLILSNNRIFLQQSHYLLVTVKAYDLMNTITQIKPFIDKNTTIIIFHNGMGTRDLLNQLLPDQPLLFMNSTYGCYLTNELINQVEPFNHDRPDQSNLNKKHLNYQDPKNGGIGTSYIGAYNDKGQIKKDISQLLDTALPRVIWVKDINLFLWQKLAINAVINPLATINRCLNGALLQQKYHNQIKQLISEICQIMNLEGYKTTEEQLTQQVYSVIKTTAQNHCSMLQDQLNHRETEIEYITGYLLFCAKKHHIRLPENEHIYGYFNHHLHKLPLFFS